MAIIINCPSCGRQLRVPDELLGKKVKCPGCQALFTGTPAPAGPVPAAATTSLPAADRTADAPPSPPPPPAAPTLNLSLDDEPAPGPRPLGTPASVAPAPPPAPPAPPSDFRECPYCGEEIRREAIRCRFCGEDIDALRDGDEEGDERPRGPRYGPRVRRDCEPHRGNFILIFGILSLVALILAGCYLTPLGLPFGIIAWVLGNRDLKMMDAGVKDPEGRGLTQAGKVCGIIGTILDGLYLLACIGGIIFFIVMMATGNMK